MDILNVMGITVVMGVMAFMNELDVVGVTIISSVMCFVGLPERNCR